MQRSMDFLPSLCRFFFNFMLQCQNRVMKTEILKAKILDLLIKGRLTSKWREEHKDIESADLLLEKIRSEKEKKLNDELVAKGKKPQKKLPIGYKFIILYGERSCPVKGRLFLRDFLFRKSYLTVRAVNALELLKEALIARTTILWRYNLCYAHAPIGAVVL